MLLVDFLSAGKRARLCNWLLPGTTFLWEITIFHTNFNECFPIHAYLQSNAKKAEGRFIDFLNIHDAATYFGPHTGWFDPDAGKGRP